MRGPWSSSAPQTADACGLIEFHDLFPPPGSGFYRTEQPVHVVFKAFSAKEQAGTGKYELVLVCTELGR